MEAVNNFESMKKQVIVEYKKELYDVTEFIHKHPGGKNILGKRHNANIELDFIKYDHSKAAEYLINEYKINPESQSTADIEYLVDWNKGVFSQIAGLGDKYTEWVNLPVDRPLQLFDNLFLEMISKTPWYLPLMFWVPIIIHTVYDQISTLNETIHAHSLVFTNMLVGVFLWTLVEYLLHRYLFHMDIKRNPNWATFHFMIHGLHHKVPFDENRLVFPPAPAAVIAAIIYQPVKFLHLINLISYPKLIMAGGITGYLCYDMIHYYIHYGNPRSKYFYNLKRYHYNHHFVQHDKGFGISNPFWDELFGTKVVLRKLKYFLKW